MGRPCCLRVSGLDRRDRRKLASHPKRTSGDPEVALWSWVGTCPHPHHPRPRGPEYPCRFLLARVPASDPKPIDCTNVRPHPHRMLGSGAPRGRVLLGRCCCAAASVSRGGGVCRAPGAAAAAALAAAAVVPTRLRQQEQWERRRWYSNDPPSRHLGPVLQVASRPLPLLLPARGLSSSSSPSPGKKEQEEKEGKGGAAHAAPGDQDHHTARAHAHARETVWTTPNLITMSRIAASPLLSWAILAGHYDYAVAGVCVAAATDWLDGYIAKTYNQTVRGSPRSAPLLDAAYAYRHSCPPFNNARTTVGAGRLPGPAGRQGARSRTLHPPRYPR